MESAMNNYAAFRLAESKSGGTFASDLLALIAPVGGGRLGNFRWRLPCGFKLGGPFFVHLLQRSVQLFDLVAETINSVQVLLCLLTSGT
jgi:hypothetical protein